MSNPQVETFARLIREKLPSYDTPEQAAAALREDYTATGVTFTEEMDRSLAAALKIVVASLENVEVLRRHSLVKERVDWYCGPTSKDLHWPALKAYLTNTKGWGDEAVASIDESSSEVVSLLANPSGESFRHRGLVVGYVQSGKTANMTAVIAKAVDAGYNLIVVLGGITNKLRAQTQRRIENDIVKRHRHHWQLYTTEDDDGDYTYPANGSFTMPVSGRAQLVVMKKVASRLEAFRRTIVDDKGKPKTPMAILRRLKVLLIDDECDQASVNSSNNEFDMTRINGEIRKIINALPAVSYVGYTATPFANVFIDPYPVNQETLDDLYPEDFITALPRPEGYFGAREVFGFYPVDPDGAESQGEAGRHMIRTVATESLGLLRPERGRDKDSFYPSMTGELESALLWFLLSCAIRRSRGQEAEHMTMLVHTSQYIVQHRRMVELIQNWVADNKEGLGRGAGKTYEKLRHIFKQECRQVPLEYGDAVFDELGPYLVDTLEALEFAVENGESWERLDFTQGPKTYIVVGGTVLARGLTLEGLSVSFFLRTSMQYDTLLQMGRWFGYRKGYEDLPRLWTTADLASNFRALASIEEEIRDDISNYRKYDVTPRELAVRVRAIPGMAITAASKMRHAYRSSISFSGRHVQTIRFDHRNDVKVSGNWSAAVSFVNRILSSHELRTQLDGRRHLVRDVPCQEVRRFLIDYHISERHMDLKKELLLGYLDEAGESLARWNVGIITPVGEYTSAKPLGRLGVVGASRRSQLAGNDGSYADIKALMSKRDILIDVEALDPGSAADSWSDLKMLRPPVPLLLLYVIAGQSRKQSASRVDLDAVGDLVGIGIVFPGGLDQSGSYYSVELDPMEPIEIQLEDNASVESLEGEAE